MSVTLVTIVHIFICVMLVVIVLLQQGKGADIGATFGGGGNTMFGASGADNLLTKATTFSAVCFMLTSIFLAVNGLGTGANQTGDIFRNLPAETAPVGAAPVESAPVELGTGESTSAETAPSASAPEAGSGEAAAPAEEAGSQAPPSDAAAQAAAASNEAPVEAAPVQPEQPEAQAAPSN